MPGPSQTYNPENTAGPGVDTDPWLTSSIDFGKTLYDRLAHGRPELREQGVMLGQMPMSPKDVSGVGNAINTGVKAYQGGAGALSAGKEALSALTGLRSKIPEADVISGFKSGDPAMEEHLLNNVLLPFARKTAGRFKGRGIDSEDLAQEGMTQGLEAARQWRDTGSSVPLPQYLSAAIRRGIDRYIMQNGAEVPLPMQQQMDIRKVASTIGKLKSTASSADETANVRGIPAPQRTIGEEPGVILTSRKSGLPVKRVKEIVNQDQSGHMVPLDEKLPNQVMSLDEDPKDLVSKLTDLGLTEKQLRAVRLNMGIGGEPMSLRAIAKEIGVASPNAVQAQIKGALAKLKKAGIEMSGKGEKLPVEPEEAPRAGGEWFQKAKAAIQDLEGKTGTKTELGESIPRVKPTTKAAIPGDFQSSLAQDMVEKAGLKWNGIQQSPTKGGDLALFTDPKTGSTVSLPANGVSPQAIQAKLAELQQRFSGEPSMPTAFESVGGSPFKPEVQGSLNWLQDTLPPTWKDMLKKGQSGMGGQKYNPNLPKEGVVNPEHPEFQELNRIAPKVAEALQRMKNSVRYGNKEQVDMPAQSWGMTSSHPDVQGTIDISNPNAGFHGAALESTRVHEPLHALYADKQIKGGLPLTGQPAEGTAINPAPDIPYAQRLMEFYKNEPQHGNIELMVNRILKSLGRPRMHRILPD